MTSPVINITFAAANVIRRLSASVALAKIGQSSDVIQLTGVASRYVGFVVMRMLNALGLFPAVSSMVQHIPEPVLDGATIVMFGVPSLRWACV